MHNALRDLDSGMEATLDTGDWEAPEVTVVHLTNLDLPETSKAPAQDEVEACMLEGYTYPLYKQLRGLKFDFVRGVHGKEGYNRWVRVVGDSESAAAIDKEVTVMLEKEGWHVDAPRLPMRPTGRATARTKTSDS